MVYGRPPPPGIFNGTGHFTPGLRRFLPEYYIYFYIIIGLKTGTLVLPEIYDHLNI